MIASEFGIEARSFLCEGDPPTVIVDIAEEKKVDLIVLGTYGRKGINRLLMGSVTSQVIINSHVDVLVVKKACSECAGTYTSILVPFDGSAFSRKAMERACRLSKIDSSDITALYIIPRYEEMLGFFRTEAIEKSLRPEADKVLDAAKEIASAQGLSVKTEILEGHASEEILKSASRERNDLILMGSYGWRGVNKAIMGSTAERVIMNAPCPVLVAKWKYERLQGKYQQITKRRHTISDKARGPDLLCINKSLIICIISKYNVLMAVLWRKNVRTWTPGISGRSCYRSRGFWTE